VLLRSFWLELCRQFISPSQIKFVNFSWKKMRHLTSLLNVVGSAQLTASYVFQDSQMIVDVGFMRRPGGFGAGIKKEMPSLFHGFARGQSLGD
jgi:hypothetical protein